MGDDPVLYRTFVQIDPLGSPGSLVSRFGPQRIHHVTPADTIPCAISRRRLKRCPPRGSTIAIAIEPKVPWSRVRS
jgi:hypothetical protein